MEEKNILQIVDDLYSGLTRKQKKIADFMLDNQDNMTFITLKELSRATGTTEITVLNMCKALGYSSFNEVKAAFRNIVNQDTVEVYRSSAFYSSDDPVTQKVIRNKSEQLDLLNQIAEEEQHMLQTLIEDIDMDHLLQIAGDFRKYNKIFICGRGISFLLSEALQSRLGNVEIGSYLINTELNENVYGSLPNFDKRTLLIAFSFPDYYYITTRVVEYAKKKGCRTLIITDRPDSDAGVFGDDVLLVRSETKLSMNTLSAPMALVNLLGTAVQITNSGRSRNVRDSFGKVF